MSEAQVKMEKDFFTETKLQLEEAANLVATEAYEAALNGILALEKQTRLASDALSTGKLLSYAVEVHVKGAMWPQLNEFLVAFSKKRGQLKHSVTAMIQKACEFVDSAPDKPTRVQLIEVLRTVSKGKIYVEVERARLTKKLVDIKEADGEIVEAANIFQELQIETFGSMEKREKTEFILEQMRLCLAKGDFVRTQIISRKISTKFFREPDTEDLKCRYLRLMVALNVHNEAYLDASKNFMDLYNTQLMQADSAARISVLGSSITYLLLAPFNEEKQTLMLHYKRIRDLDQLPEFSQMLDDFTRQELIKWSTFTQRFQQVIFAALHVAENQSTAANQSSPSRDFMAVRGEHLRKRCLEHSVRVVSLFYTRITLARLAAHLDVSQEEAEQSVAELVTAGTVWAKIDRLKATVNFVKVQQPVDVLSEWSDNVNNLMRLLSKTNHLIKKERMIAGKA